MADTLDPASAAAAVSFNNVKNLGELHALTAGLSGQNVLAQQQRVNEIANSVLANSMNAAQQMAQLAASQSLNLAASQAQLQQAITGRVARFMLDLSAEEAVAFTKQVGADIQDKLSNIEAAISGGQVYAKTAQTTPPQTGTGGAFGSDAGSALLQQLVNAQVAQSQSLAGVAQGLASIQAMLQSLGAQTHPPTAPK